MTLWARRRAAVAAEQQAEANERTEAGQRAQDAAMAARPDEELLAEAGVKPPEELLDADEVRAFLKHELPERLKRQALRRLWRLNPVLANVDGLVDYGEDFTDKAMCIENMQTVYTVGKGMLAQFRALEDDPEAAPLADATADAASEDPAVITLPAETEMSAPSTSEEASMQVANSQEIGLSPTGADVSDPLARRQRRMRFTFERT